MTRATVLAAGRRAAEAGMGDACIIRRETASTTDRETGHRTPTLAVIYTGRCRIQEVVPFTRQANPSPDQVELAVSRTLQLPVTTSTGVREGDLAEITACVHDPDLVGVVMVVRSETGKKSEATSRRLGLEEMT
jgi:hypothetical protein